MKKIVLFLITSLLFTVVLLSVKNSYSAFIKNVQTSLEVTTPKLEAIFLPGTEFSGKIKQIAGNSNSTNETTNTNITSIVRSNVLTITPTVNNIVSASDSSFPIYAWFSNGVIYYYTEVEHPKTNSYAKNMFRGLTNLTSIDISTLDTSLTTDFDGMFFEDSSITILDLSNFDTSSAIYMGGMFYKCHSLTSLNVSSFDTSEVTQMHLMFYETKKLQSLDISNFDMSNVSIISNMMDKMIDLKELKTPDIYPNDTSKAITLPKKMYDSNLIEYTLLYKGSSPISPTKTIIKEGYEVTFDANSGSVNPISKVLTYDNTTYGSLPTPTKTDYTFLGWNGKNLLNMNAWLSSFSDGHYCSIVAKGNNAITLTATSDDCYTNSWYSSDSYAIKVKPNTTYTLSWNIDSSNVKVRNFVFVNDVPSSPYMTYVDEVGATKLTFTTTSDAEFITFRLGVSLSGETITYSNLQLEENSDVTEYEPYYVTSSTSLVQREDHTLKAIYATALTNNKKDYDYTGSAQEFIVPKTGTYKLETWGAQGGSINGMVNYEGAMGGYSNGEIQLYEGQKIYITVGGKGTSLGNKNTVLDNGTGYNGGGVIASQSSPRYYGSGGGGATHITNTLLGTGLLSDYSANTSRILIVSGGGGGSSTSSTSENNDSTNGPGGAGGGFKGVDGTTTYVGTDTRTPGTGGTQTTIGLTDDMTSNIYGKTSAYIEASFGKGCQAVGDYDTTGYMRVSGGGGLYGGGCGVHSGGGGGSSYIGNSKLVNKSMYCYGCQEDLTNIGTFTVSTIGSSAYKDTTSCPSGYSSSPVSKCAKAGNGYARITLISAGETWNYAYNGTDGTDGSVQVFTVPAKGTYKIETWGASGGDKDSYTGGLGAYTSGNISLNQNETLYLYVGGAGSNTDYGGYNGGGDLILNERQANFGSTGGGSTDIRLTNGSWDNFDSLKSRIMVAGGGGGANHRSEGYGDGNGGDAGGLIGYPGDSINHTNTYGYAMSAGGTQTSGGESTWVAGTANINISDAHGLFGKTPVGNADTAWIQSGAGNGYYSGGAGNHCGGAGGSSFISGYSGSNAISPSSTSSNIVHTGSPNHYSGKIFTSGVMIDGKGCNWSSGSASNCGANQIQPNGSYATGHMGNGYARITLVSLD